MIAIELLILLSTILPLFHLLNALVGQKRNNKPQTTPEREISILVPCFNEEDTVRISVSGLLKSEYSNYEAIYINDGSVDGTMQQLDAVLDLYALSDAPPGVNAAYRSARHENFFVLDTKNGGKSAALNAGIAFASTDIVVTLDADSVLERRALSIISRAFDDEDVAAAGGAIHIMQGYAPKSVFRRLRRSRAMIVALQMLEYLKGFYIYKFSLAKQNATAIISGAFGAFRKQVLLDAGGFRHTLGEDIDITISIQRVIHRTKRKIMYLPEALCCTQCPEYWSDLKKQRIRWQKGFIDCAVHHRRFLLKTMLFKSLSFHFVVEALAVGHISCIFTLITLAAMPLLGVIDPQAMGTFLLYNAICAGVSLIYSLAALLISSRYHRYPSHAWGWLLAAMLLDVLFYRYFTLLMYLGGTVSCFWSRRSAQNWGRVARSRQSYYVPNA